MRKLLTTILCALLVISLAACGATPVSTTTAPAQTTTASTAAAETTKATEIEKKDPVTLKVWIAKQEIVEPFGRMLETYKAANPHVELVAERPGGDQYYSTIKVLLAAGDAPDVFALGVGQLLKEYTKNGMLAELDPNDYDVFESAKEATMVDGKMMALPMDIAGIGVIYNKKIFADAGIVSVPKTVSELKDAMAKIKAINVVPFGVAFKDAWTLRQLFAIGHTATVDLTDFVSQMNAGTTSFKNDKMEKTFEVFDMIAANSNAKPLDSDYNNLCTIFAEGKVAMMVQGLWALGNVTKITPDIETGMFALPVSENSEDAKMMGDVDSTFCLYSGSENMEESKSFLKWLTQKEATDMWTQDCKLISSVKGTKAPSSIGAAAEDLLGYFNDNKVFRWGFREWPTGYDMELASYFQAYFAKSIDKETYYKTIDELWADSIQ